MPVSKHAWGLYTPFFLQSIYRYYLCLLPEHVLIILMRVSVLQGEAMLDVFVKMVWARRLISSNVYLHIADIHIGFLIKDAYGRPQLVLSLII